MDKTKISSVWKQCMYCGKLYPPKTDQKRCNCERHGWLLEVRTWYQPKKTKGGANGTNKIL